MKVEFDPNKDALNRQKHGVSLAEAAYLEWETELAWVDERYHYDEVRISALVLRGIKLFFVVYTDRGDIRRVISLRKATKRELLFYVDEN